MKKIVIIDANALMHRAWHAIPPLKTKDGRLINAAYGFTMTLLKSLKDISPDYLAVTFDVKGPTFRHEEYSEYKAGRKKKSDEFYNQFAMVKEILQAFKITVFEKIGFEADDLIGTISKVVDDKYSDLKTVIVTGDLDALQLINKNTEVYTLKKGVSESFIYKPEQVKERYQGLGPDQIIDYKALRGDPSDNIPGVPGVGDKTAINLLNEFKTLENLYENLDSAESENKIKPRILNLLKENKEQAFLSQKLATIKLDVEIDFDLENCKLQDYDTQEVFDLFQDLEFKSLLRFLPGRSQKHENTKTQKTQKQNNNYNLINTDEEFNKFLEKLKKQKEFCFDTETTGLNPLEDKLLGLSFSWKEGEAYYVIAEDIFLQKLKSVFEDEKIKKIGHNIKFDMKSLFSVGVKLKGISFDTMIASYLLTPGTRAHKLDNLVFKEFAYEMQSIEELIGKKGPKQTTLEFVDLQKTADYACEDADYTYRLKNILEKRLEEESLKELFEKIEMPLIEVLVEMEKNGISLDTKNLEKLENKVQKDLDKLTLEIYELAGEEFNINSPMQLKKILFEKLEIPTQGLKRTKTGFSTAAAELEKMKDLHPIIKLISEYRELNKLQNTYIQALPKLISDKSARIHTSFNQTVTATGRLSSSDPNLQNIPIRTELGREIRQAFVARKGCKLIAADYSQVELRVVACLANDKNMIEVFKKGQDIHSTTAANIFEVSLEKVTKEMRRKAKAVNFGVLYGMGSFGLAKRTGLSRNEAKEFIEKYFQVYKDVKNYLDKTIEEVKETEEVKTLFGRVRHLPEINSGVQMLRATAERMAINMPVQGTAADLMKISMIEVFKELQKVSPESKLLLQVHDELVIEVPEKEVKKVVKIIDEKMEKIHKLCVPIKVETKIGDNWEDMETIL